MLAIKSKGKHEEVVITGDLAERINRIAKARGISAGAVFREAGKGTRPADLPDRPISLHDHRFVEQHEAALVCIDHLIASAGSPAEREHAFVMRARLTNWEAYTLSEETEKRVWAFFRKHPATTPIAIVRRAVDDAMDVAEQDAANFVRAVKEFGVPGDDVAGKAPAKTRQVEMDAEVVDLIERIAKKRGLTVVSLFEEAFLGKAPDAPREPAVTCVSSAVDHRAAAGLVLSLMDWPSRDGELLYDWKVSRDAWKRFKQVTGKRSAAVLADILNRGIQATLDGAAAASALPKKVSAKIGLNASAIPPVARKAKRAKRVYRKGGGK